jgi:peptidoglycan/LPS O-acetylase OafA/YrhL
MIIFDYLLLNELQFSTALFMDLFLLLSGLIGFTKCRQWIEGGAWGFSILAGSIDLAIFISRTVGLPTTVFGLQVLAVRAIIGFVLCTSPCPASASRSN